jgi:ParB-like chromosome segregation protein Spo0J
MSTTEHIAEDLRPLAQPIDLLKLLPGNPRRGDVEAVMRSYDRFGQRKPIVARRDGTVIAGNHQLQAAQRLGWSHIAVVWTDDDDLTAKAFALADNRTADLGAYDDDDLRALIESVAIDPNLLAAASYSLDDLLDDANDIIGNGDSVDIGERYEVVIECATELEQEALLLRFSNEGLKVRAIVV